MVAFGDRHNEATAADSLLEIAEHPSRQIGWQFYKALDKVRDNRDLLNLMHTLTNMKAKKARRLLHAAARREDIGIVSRKVQVESADYARKEYGVSKVELGSFQTKLDRRFSKLRAQERLIFTTDRELREILEKTSRTRS